MNDSNELLLTVVVCTYNRSPLLQSCLQSLVAQTADNKKFEILVVNNNSDDNTMEIACSFSTLFQKYRVIKEKEQGLSYARNRGWNAAKAEYVGYLDDDAIVEDDYIEIILNIISNYNFDCFGGGYLPWYKYGKKKWFPDSYASVKYPYTTVFSLKEELFLCGGNCVYRKSMLKKTGGFSVTHGMVGDKLGYGEETSIQIKFRNLGYSTVCVPNLYIYHLVPLYKQRVSWQLYSAYIKGFQLWDIYNKQPNIFSLLRLLCVLIYKELAFIAKIFSGYVPPFKCSFRQFFVDFLKPLVNLYGQMKSGILLIFK